MSRCLLYLVLVLLPVCAAAQAEQPVEYTVSYVSVDHVYIDAGRADGLGVGDRLAKMVNGNAVTELEVVYTSMHSASCRYTSEGATLVAGDRLIIVFSAVSTDTTAAVVPPSTSIQEGQGRLQPVRTEVSPPGVKLFGNVSMSLYQRWDNSDANVDFTQTSARLNLRAENFLIEHTTLAVRTLGRYDARNRTYLTGGTRTEWRNRLWVLSMEYDNPDAVLSFQVGRFLPVRLGSVGYLDGALVRARISNRFQAAVLAGQRPDWAYGERTVTLSRYGAYVSYRPTDRESAYIEQTLGMVAEYHKSTPSRAFLAMRGVMRLGRAAGLSHSLELDVNRGWRLERTGESVSLSNLFVNSWLRMSRAVRISLQYDNRQNYWTYEYRSLADSLFDDRVRHGIRGRLDVSLTSRDHLSGSLGHRTTEGGGRRTTSYSGSYRHSGIFGYNAAIMLSYFGFDGSVEYGSGYSVGTQLPPGRLGAPYLAVSGYSYSVEGYGDARSSTSFEAGTTLDFSSGYYVGGSGQWDVGDDINGPHIFLEFGYRY